MFSHQVEVEMTRKHRKEHDLVGFEAEDQAGTGILTEVELQEFVYSPDEALEGVGIRGLYLGNYLRWASKTQPERMISMFSYEPSPQQRALDIYNYVDCYHYFGLHDYVKFLKSGYGSVTDHTSREIRLSE